MLCMPLAASAAAHKARVWIDHDGENCYPGHGAVSLELAGGPDGTIERSLDRCKLRCLRTPNCTAITARPKFQGGGGVATICWLRSEVRTLSTAAADAQNVCELKKKFHTYVLAPKGTQPTPKRTAPLPRAHRRPGPTNGEFERFCAFLWSLPTNETDSIYKDIRVSLYGNRIRRCLKRAWRWLEVPIEAPIDPSVMSGGGSDRVGGGGSMATNAAAAAEAAEAAAAAAGETFFTRLAGCLAPTKGWAFDASGAPRRGANSPLLPRVHACMHTCIHAHTCMHAYRCDLCRGLEGHQHARR